MAAKVVTQPTRERQIHFSWSNFKFSYKEIAYGAHAISEHLANIPKKIFHKTIVQLGARFAVAAILAVASMLGYWLWPNNTATSGEKIPPWSTEVTPQRK